MLPVHMHGVAAYRTIGANGKRLIFWLIDELPITNQTDIPLRAILKVAVVVKGL